MSVLMRIMTNYLQILTISLSFNLKFPTFMEDSFSSIGKIGGSSGVFLSFDCLLLDTPIQNSFRNIEYFKVLCLSLFPIVLIVAPTIVYRLVFLKNSPKFWRWTWVTVITVMFLLHPTLTQYCLRLFKCSDISNGQSRVEMDIVTECWSSQHLKWIFSLGKLFYLFNL
jgi:hypothetical protein